MLKDKLYIHDTIFSHAKSSSWHNEPKMFDWVRKYDEEHLVFTDFSIDNVKKFNNKKKYAWLLESPEINQKSREFILNNYFLFDKIFTFDCDLLKLNNNVVLTPIGGCWIDESHRMIHEKTKDISMVLSNKRFTSGHNLRHNIYNTFKNIDYYGFMNPIEDKITALKDYKFSIVIENSKKDYYFTEKIIDCFITGTIPIYWGCPSIGEFFDVDGIITFNTIDELSLKLINLDGEYEKKFNSVLKNFNLCKKYLIADEIIYKNIKKND